MIRKLLVSTLLLFSLGLMSPPITFAADGDTTSGFDVFDVFSVDQSSTDNVNGSTTISNTLRDYADENTGGNIVIAVIMRAINVLLLLIGTFAFLVIFYSGVLLVTANGDEGKIEKGKNMIVPAIMGLLFAFLSYYITVFVQSFFY